MFNFYFYRKKIYDTNHNDNTGNTDINDIVNDAIYRLLYHKISNYTEITEIDMNSILLLPYENKIKILKLFNECIKNLISYNNFDK